GWFGGSLRSIERWVPGGGILVTSLVAGEPADGSGVRDGDWIHTWAGHPVTDLPAFMQLVASSEPGRTIPVGIWRQGKRVLTRFTAGRRPVGQGRLVLHKPLWVDEQLRVLVPGRTGLTWVDPRKATRTPHWSWKERGVVRRCLAVGGDVYVSINRGILPDLVVAVDAVRGTERWRAEVQGGVTWFEPVGSGLWIHTVAPGQGLLVDREDGRPRARFRTFDRYRHAFRKNWEPDREVALAAGRGYVSAGTDSDLWFRIVNTTTGSTQEAAHWKYAGGGGFRGRYVNPQVSAGAYATVACQGGLRFFFGDPLGEQPPRQLQAARRDLMGTETHHGPIDSDTRLYVRGHTLYVVRMPLQGRKNVNVHVFGIDYDALRRRPLTAQGSPGPVLFNRTHRAWLTGPSSPYRYTLNVRATFEGILVSTAQLSGGHHGETWWIACATEDSYDENRDLKLLWSPMAEARRHAPRPVGARLFVPVDRGARVFPIRRYADESK
ncbi:MAG: PDZ domain-containing protein, partial [Planctomycetota bacterium]|nr:PDZ domain-containing protein [Planctomycetota bacterium]